MALTAGKDGCALACASGGGEVCCVTQAAVALGAPAKDTTGAGDAFLGLHASTHTCNRTYMRSLYLFFLLSSFLSPRKLLRPGSVCVFRSRAQLRVSRRRFLVLVAELLLRRCLGLILSAQGGLLAGLYQRLCQGLPAVPGDAAGLAQLARLANAAGAACCEGLGGLPSPGSLARVLELKGGQVRTVRIRMADHPPLSPLFAHNSWNAREWRARFFTLPTT